MATRVTDSSSSSLGLYLRTNPIRALEWKGGERGKEGGTRRESVKASRPFSLFPMLLFFLLPSASANLLHLSWSSCRLITYCLTARKSTMPSLSTTFVSSLFDRIVNRQCVITVIPDVILRQHRKWRPRFNNGYRSVATKPEVGELSSLHGNRVARSSGYYSSPRSSLTGREEILKRKNRKSNRATV